MNGLRKKLSAFTLIELLVVIAIIAVLMAVLLPEDEQRLAKEIDRARTLALEQLQDDFMAVVEAELG